MGQVGPKMGPRRPQEKPTMAQDSPKTAQQAPRCIRDGPKTSTELHVGAQEVPPILEKPIKPTGCSMFFEESTKSS